jgi:DNA repair exonuclease SbcCD ATPase subunit
VVSAASFVCLAMVFSATGLCQVHDSAFRRQRIEGDRLLQRAPTRPVAGEITDDIRKKRKMQIEQQLKRLKRQVHLLTLNEQIQDLNTERMKLQFEQRKRQAEEQALSYAIDQQIQVLNQKKRQLQTEQRKRQSKDRAAMLALDRKIQELNNQRRKVQADQRKEQLEDQIRSLTRELEDLSRDKGSGPEGSATSDESAARSR